MTTNKQYDSNWELLPGVGLGKAVFDMTRLEVSALKDVLGEITGENNLSLQKEQLLATYDMLKDFFTEEDLKNVMEALDETSAQRGVIETEYRATGLTLEYEDGKLTEFFADNRANQLHFQGIPVFSNSLSLIKHMASVLQENPLIKDDELVFQNNNIYLFSFIRKDFTESDASNRTITWRKDPRPLSVSLSDYQMLKII
ncbi:PAS domain-containing protein [Pedobacter caeni]|uniref:Uncharacterized protein n=1 Tax=Pedobacter caeni TaxID=288992 RepID=A0A1M4VDK8_9SPHI|nr:PAS domain-containing protein [Pedobacter caeni]SHE67046.1 hypothetical protein SAMN04488522_101873 [Pedobacter caeni]